MSKQLADFAMRTESEKRKMTLAYEVLMKEIKDVDRDPIVDIAIKMVEVIEIRLLMVEMKLADAELAIAELRKL